MRGRRLTRAVQKCFFAEWLLLAATALLRTANGSDAGLESRLGKLRVNAVSRTLTLTRRNAWVFAMPHFRAEYRPCWRGAATSQRRRPAGRKDRRHRVVLSMLRSAHSIDPEQTSWRRKSGRSYTAQADFASMVARHGAKNCHQGVNGAIATTTPSLD